MGIMLKFNLNNIQIKLTFLNNKERLLINSIILCFTTFWYLENYLYLGNLFLETLSH